MRKKCCFRWFWYWSANCRKKFPYFRRWFNEPHYVDWQRRSAIVKTLKLSKSVNASVKFWWIGFGEKYGKYDVRINSRQTVFTGSGTFFVVSAQFFIFSIDTIWYQISFNFCATECLNDVAIETPKRNFSVKYSHIESTDSTEYCSFCIILCSFLFFSDWLRNRNVITSYACRCRYVQWTHQLLWQRCHSIHLRKLFTVINSCRQNALDLVAQRRNQLSN